MPAIDNGMSLGADGLEIDVQLSADGIPVVIHDQTLDRTTDRTGPGQRSRRPRSSRASMRASSSRSTARIHFAARASACRGSMTCSPDIPTRAHHHRDEGRAAGAGARGGRVGQESRRGRSHVRRLVPSELDRHDSRRASGDRHERVAARRRAGRCIDRGCGGRGSSARPYVAFQVPENAGRMRVVSPAFVRQVHHEGQVMQVWVVNERADIERLLDWGVDGIISDRPDIAVAHARPVVSRTRPNDSTDPARRVCRARARHAARAVAHRCCAIRCSTRRRACRSG